ncbi:MAG: hypothetical protein QOG96_6806, partial [Pseudonocardiales bacterium]|nr:hypothetical protein [Pseudonocardiales bacterium]
MVFSVAVTRTSRIDLGMGVLFVSDPAPDQALGAEPETNSASLLLVR